MIVRNVFIDDFDLYIEILLRDLIKLGINYTLVENEVHFDNYIIRIYETKINTDFIDNIRKVACKEVDEVDDNYRINKKLIKNQNKLTNKMINTKGYR